MNGGGNTIHKRCFLATYDKTGNAIPNMTTPRWCHIITLGTLGMKLCFLDKSLWFDGELTIEFCLKIEHHLFVIPNMVTVLLGNIITSWMVFPVLLKVTQKYAVLLLVFWMCIRSPC